MKNDNENDVFGLAVNVKVQLRVISTTKNVGEHNVKGSTGIILQNIKCYLKAPNDLHCRVCLSRKPSRGSSNVGNYYFF